MYSKELEELIDAALADGVLTEKEKQILFKKAKAQGIDLDEFEMVLNTRLLKVQQSQSVRPTKEKKGNIITCPHCGAVVQAYHGRCPECGFEFENVEANLSSQKLATLLQHAKTDSQKKEIIETFPIPNTKTDLLEFLTALKPRILDVGDTFANSYHKKYQECIEKAKISFANDTLVKGYIDEFERINKSIVRIKKTRRYKLIIPIIAIVLIGIGITLFFTLRVNYRGNENDCEMMVRKSIQAGNLDKAEYYLYSFKYSECLIDKAYTALVEAHLKNGNIEHAKQIADHYMTDIDRGKVIKPLYEYLINHKKYEDAEKYITDDQWGWVLPQEYYNYLLRSIEGMCKDGKCDDAKIFLISRCNYFAIEGDGDHKYRRIDVFNELSAIISYYSDLLRTIDIEDSTVSLEEDSLLQEVNEDSPLPLDKLPIEEKDSIIS